MRIIYLPDWNDKIKESRFKIMNRFGDEIYAPDLSYIHNRNLISSISNDVNHNDSNLIVGDLMGAYLALYVSNITKIPALLFNPSFYFKNGGELRAAYDQEQFSEKKIILSAKHNVVDTKRTFKYLRELGYDNQLKIFDNLTQDIPIDLFEMYFTEFRAKYLNFESPYRRPKSDKLKQKYFVSADAPVAGRPVFEVRRPDDEIDTHSNDWGEPMGWSEQNPAG